MMKPLSIVFLSCVFLFSPCFAADSSSAGSSSGANVVDEDLMLDDGPSDVLPLEKKTAAPSSKIIESPAGVKSAEASPPGPLKTPVVTPAPVGSPARGAIDTAAETQPPTPPKSGAHLSGELTPARPPASKVADTVKKIIDEDLILDGGEEDLLGQEKKPVTKNAGGRMPDSSVAAQGVISAGGSADSAAGRTEPVASEQNAALKTATLKSSRTPAASAKIENARSINFAANLKDYRSPKVAMLMSFLLPGSGQVYAKSGWWAAGFLAVEAAIVSTGLIYSSKSGAKKASAHKFADTAYSATRFEQYTRDLKSNLAGLHNGDTIYDSYFFDSGDVHFLIDAKKDPANRSNQFYDDIAREESPFVRGWNDVEPDFTGGHFTFTDTSVYHVYPGTDSSYYVYRYNDKTDFRFGFSANQLHYIDLLNESRRLANISRTAFITLLINHLASAVMAGIEAKNHNDALLGKETFWRRINVEQQFVNTGSETVAGYSVGVRF